MSRRLSDAAAQAAIGAAARELQLPTVRDRGGPAGRDRRPGTPHLPGATSPKSWPPRSTTAPNGAAPAASPTPVPAPQTAGRLQHRRRPRHRPRDPRPAWPLAHYMDAGEPVVLLGDSGTGKTHLLIGLGLAACEQGRRVRYVTTAATGQRTRRSRRRTSPVPRGRPATAAWTCSASTSSATSRSTPAEPSCCSRSSPKGKNEPPSRSRRICRSANGAPSSPTPAWSPPSSTGSPSTPTSSRPAPSPTGSAPARPPPAPGDPAKPRYRHRGQNSCRSVGPNNLTTLTLHSAPTHKVLLVLSS